MSREGQEDSPGEENPASTPGQNKLQACAAIEWDCRTPELRELDFNSARLQMLRLGYAQFKHTMLELGRDFVAVEFLG